MEECIREGREEGDDGGQFRNGGQQEGGGDQEEREVYGCLDGVGVRDDG